MTKPARVGKKMAAITEYVRLNPGCSMLAAAEFVGGNRKCRMLGYEPAWRAVRAGLVRAEPGPRKGTRLLFPV